jgi:TM2 domain-containing membrane protein YozV
VIRQTPPIAILATLLAWLIPGAGHVYAGRMARGIIIFVVVGATFWTGVALGGIKTVDQQAERYWFFAQMVTGVHGLTGWQRQRGTQEAIASDNAKYANAASPENITLVAPVDTVARAYSGVAGLLNLLCIFDATILALLGSSGEPPKPARKEKISSADGEGVP